MNYIGIADTVINYYLIIQLPIFIYSMLSCFNSSKLCFYIFLCILSGGVLIQIFIYYICFLNMFFFCIKWYFSKIVISQNYSLVFSEFFILYF